MRNCLFALMCFQLFGNQMLIAKIKLPAIISSNMVLQRNTNAPIWGWADPNEIIYIKASWLTKKISLRADESGYWRCTLKTTSSQESKSIRIIGKSSDIHLENILFGEVWLCSGQSNMEQPLKGFKGQPTFYSNMAIAKSKNDKLRLFTVNRNGSQERLNDIEYYVPWQSSNPENIKNFSAIGYFYGQELQKILGCPIGIIHSSWGGSSIRSWIGDVKLASYKGNNDESVEYPKEMKYDASTLYNAMIHPIVSYKIKGILWYQGETNREEPENYSILFPSLVNNWRVNWGLGNIPFFYVQIAPFPYRDNEAFQTTQNSAFIREVQMESLERIANSGIAITMDIGDKNTIHPPEKKIVANRLLFNALNKVYGYYSVDSSGPIYDSYIIRDNDLILRFKNAEEGLFSYDKLKGFEIAGSDKIFYPAFAEIINRGMEILVKSDKVPNPRAVRYCWRNWIEGTLYDTNLLPSSSFRTDRWKDAKRFSNSLR